MSNDLRLRVIMDLANKASGPLRNITQSSTEAAKALKGARETLKKLNEQQRAVDGLHAQQAALRESTNRLRVLRQNVEMLRQSETASQREITTAERALVKQTAAYEKNRDAVFRLRSQLNALGVGNISQAQAQLKTAIASTNQVMEQQVAKLKALHLHQGKLRQLNERHAREMLHTGMLAGAGAAGMAVGRGMGRPVMASMGAYGQQESASSQLSGSMMLANGQVSAEFKQINELAMRLGDRLPGTTADFIEMMTMLRRQGLSAKSILGGTGEAAAYLGVQLQMPATAAAEFAAKMQDATRTSEREMMGLMDLIQRTYYLGVDSGNMLQGFTKVGPSLSILKKEGLDAANALAPLLVMMDQTGMAGEASGNGIRKVIQAGLDMKKLGKANAALQGAGAGFELNFVNDKGEFAGLDHLFGQLQKIKTITNQVHRTSVLKELFGDDSETQQVVTTLMDKGLAGYNEVADKMRAQADLRKRVDQQLQTFNNLKDSASGSFTNVMAAIGETIAPDAKALVEFLGELASGTRAWIAEHPTLVGWLARTVAVIAGLTFGFSALLLAVAGVLGPFFVMRFAMAFMGLKFSFLAMAIGGVSKSIAFLRGALMLMAANPVLLAISAIVIAIAAAAYLIYKNWGPITAFFANLWNNIKAGLSGLWQSFTQMGGMLMDGLINGITNRLAALKSSIVGVADSAVGWFREKLGIRSPSRVFMAAGEHLGQGAAIGISRSSDLVRKASVGMAAAAALGMPGAAGAEPLRIDQRPPLTAGAGMRAPAVLHGDTITIQITAGPGTDPKALALAISAELDRRDRAKSARMRSSLGDIG